MKKLLKSIYSLVPFKKQMFSVIKTFWTPPSSIYSHLHFKAPFDVKISDKEQFKMHHFGYEIENEIFWKGLQNGWEKQSLSLWIPLSRKAKVVVDIGANTGIYSLITKAVNPSAKVYAFEPVKRVYQKLCENNKLNGFDIHSIEKAASNFTGEATIYDQATEHTYSVTVNKNMNTGNAQIVTSTIETLTLKDFIESNKISHIDLMKIDVETHEPEVLEGMDIYLKKFQPTLLIEILNDEVGDKVRQLVSGINYLYFNIDENNGIRQVTDITKSDYYNYLLCSREVALELKLLEESQSLQDTN